MELVDSIVGGNLAKLNAFRTLLEDILAEVVNQFRPGPTWLMTWLGSMNSTANCVSPE